MKKQAAKTVEAPIKHKVGADRTQVGKSAIKSRGQRHKLAGKTNKLLAKQDEQFPLCGSTEALGPHLLDEGKCSAEKAMPRQHPERTFHSSGKIKLQLFPLDEVTRMGLEKNGYHPYLELTLSARKKISSVLKHLNHKWGRSSIVTGQPVLLPYNVCENLASCRWTLNDIDLRARDVHAAIGSPSIFRLRYAWLSDGRNKSSEVPSTSAPCDNCLYPEDMKKDCTGNVERMYGKEKQVEETSKQLKPTFVSGATDVSAADKTSSCGLVEPACNDVKMHAALGQSSLWDDSLTNISIGGLLSEASLQGRFSSDPKLDGSNAGLLSSQLITDSFDAFIMSQVNHSQAPRLPHGTSSSILDAEDTCHAFAFQKFSFSGKDAVALGGSAYSRTSSLDAVSKSFKNPNLNEASIHSVLPQSQACQDSETDLSLCARLYNDENSLGLSGIKWMDSLGAFDLGLSSSRKIINGDSLSLSKIIS